MHVDPGPALSVNSPFSKCGTPAANSTTSRPRCRSPWASATVLPCSEDNSRARESRSPSTSWRKRSSTRERRCGFHCPQSACASSAFAMAASVSARPASGTRAWTAPVLGSCTSVKRPEDPVVCLPPMKWVSSRTMGACSRQVGSGDGTADRRTAPDRVRRWGRSWDWVERDDLRARERVRALRRITRVVGTNRCHACLLHPRGQHGTSAAGILTPGSPRAARLPDRPRQWRVDGSTLPGHSGGTVPVSHRLPCTADLVPRTYSWTS